MTEEIEIKHWPVWRVILELEKFEGYQKSQRIALLMQRAAELLRKHEGYTGL